MTEVQNLFDKKDNVCICKYCNNQYDCKCDKEQLEFCSSYCEFMKRVIEHNKEIETLMQKNPFKCKICKKQFRLTLNNKTYFPYCSRKCMSQGHEKNTKEKLLKYLGWLGIIHNGKITNKQITPEIKKKIDKYYPSNEKAVEASGNKYFVIRKGFMSAGRLSKAYKRLDLDGLFLRSSWEANVIRILKFFKWKFEYEPRCFDFPVKKGNRFYLPDLYINKTKEWWEIKGFLDNNSKTKIARFKKYYPDERLFLIGKDCYKYIKNIGFLLPTWEFNTVDDIVKNMVFKDNILNKEK